MKCPRCGRTESKRWILVTGEKEKTCYLCYKKVERNKNQTSYKQSKDKSYYKNSKNKNKNYLQSMTNRYSALCLGANRRNIQVSLSYEQYRQVLSGGKCHYSGQSLPFSLQKGHFIDRINSDAGYTLDNVVPCMPWVNDLKGARLSYQDTLDTVKFLIEKNGLSYNYPTKAEDEFSSVILDKVRHDVEGLLAKLQKILGGKILEGDLLQLENLKISVQNYDNPKPDWDKADVWFRPKEILTKPDVIKSLVEHKLGNCSKIYARKCSIRKLEINEYVDFFDQNHLKGKAYATTFGLIHQGEIVCAMSYKANSRHGVSIDRFANKLGISVLGGFSRLLKQVEEDSNSIAIYSFVDLRYHKGDGLKDFELLATTKGWGWTDGSTEYNRLKCKADLSLGISQAENAKNKGWWQIFDRGQAKFAKYREKRRVLPTSTEAPNTALHTRYKRIQADTEDCGYKLVTSIEELENSFKRELAIKVVCDRGHQTDILMKGWEQGVRCRVCKPKTISLAGISNALRKFRKIQQEVKEAKLELMISFDTYCKPHLENRKKRFLRLKCEHGHIFTRMVDQWNRQKTCPECTGKVNYTSRYKERMLNSHWEHQSGTYINKTSRLTAKCVKCGEIATKQYKVFRDSPHKCNYF